MKRIFFSFVKNILVFLGSGFFALLVIFLFSKKSILGFLNNSDAGLAGVASAPVLVVYFIVFGIGGGILGVIIYNLIKFFKK